MAQTDNQEGISSIIPNLRQYELLEKVKGALERAVHILDSTEEGAPLAVCDLKEAIECLDSAAGVKVDEDMLEHIFRQFCIGK